MKIPNRFFSLALMGAIGLTLVTPASADQQKKRILTAEDYAHAEKFLRQQTNPLVFGTSVRPNWIDEDSFWYRNNISEGYEFVLVDGKKKQRKMRLPLPIGRPKPRKTRPSKGRLPSEPVLSRLCLSCTLKSPKTTLDALMTVSRSCGTNH